MWNAGQDEAQAGIKIAGRNIITSDMQMTLPLWQKVKKNKRASWWKWKRRVKNRLKTQHSENKDHGIQSHHFMTSSPITSWQIDGETMETMRDFIFWGSKITADGNFSHEIKRHLLLGRKAMTILESILKRDITLPTKIHIFKVMVIPVVMYRFECWVTKKAECWRTDAFELWFWRRLFRVPWIARKSNQSILKEISPEYSLEELMLKLKLQYLGHLMQRTDPLEKILMLSKTEGRRRRRWQRMRWYHQLNEHEFAQTPRVSEGQERLTCCSLWCLKDLDTT